MIKIDKNKLHFKGKPRIVANSFVVTIPKAFLEHDLIKEGKLYKFDISEVVEDGQDN